MTHTVDAVIPTVTTLVATEFGVPENTLTPDSDLTAVPGADSVKVLRVVAKIERTYDIELDDDDVFSLKTIRDVATVVSAATAA